MKPALFLMVAGLSMTGCGSNSGVTASSNMVETATPVAAGDEGQGARFVCTDGREVRAVFLDPESLTLHIGADTIAMRAAVAPRGARYIGDRWQWWTQGLQQATLTPLKAGETLASAKGTDCHVR